MVRTTHRPSGFFFFPHSVSIFLQLCVSSVEIALSPNTTLNVDYSGRQDTSAINVRRYVYRLPEAAIRRLGDFKWQAFIGLYFWRLGVCNQGISSAMLRMEALAGVSLSRLRSSGSHQGSGSHPVGS